MSEGQLQSCLDRVAVPPVWAAWTSLTGGRAQSLLRLAANLGLAVDDDDDSGHANCTQQTAS